jgi:hypothetical protein
MTEIEALLGKASPRLPWVMAGEASQQRRVLEETYQYLQSLQANSGAPGGWGSLDPATGQIAPVDSDATADNPEAHSQQILQALLQEMQYLRSQTLQPLRTEVVALQQQREQLLNEVRQLELQRLQGAAQPAASLPPSLVDELVERLREALVSQLRSQSPGASSGLAALYGNVELPALEEQNDLPQLRPQQRLEQLRHIQAQTDYMLLKLDTNLRTVFESMEQSIQSYRDSLHQGLDTMHGLGQQGEVIFKTLINHLAQQLGQEQAAQTQAAYLDAAASAIPSSLRATPEPDPELGTAEIQYAEFQDWEDLESDTVEVTDDLSGPGLALPDDLPLAIDLEDLDLGEVPVDEDITLFQLDEEITQLQLDNDLDDDDASDLLDVNAFEADEAQVNDNQPEDETVVQRSSLSWPDPSSQSPRGTASDTAAIADEAKADTEIDALYESLFGEPDTAATDADADAPTTAPLTADSPLNPDNSFDAGDPLDQVLLSTDSDFALAAEPELIAPDLDDLIPADENLADAVGDITPADFTTGLDDAEVATVDDLGDAEFAVDGSVETVDRPLEGEDNAADLDLEALDQALDQSLFEIPESAPTTPEAVAENLSKPPTLADLLGPDEIPESPDQPSTEAGLATHTIASLAELLPADNETVTPLFEGMSLDLEMDEDSFIPAPSDEDLLSNPPGATPWDPELKLTTDALDQLSTDLVNLESASSDSHLDFETAPAAATPATASTDTPPLTEESLQEVAEPAPPNQDVEALNLDVLLPELSLNDLSLADAPATDESSSEELSLDPQLDLTPAESVLEDWEADTPADRADQDLTLQGLTLDEAFTADSTDLDGSTAAAAETDEDLSELLKVWTADSDLPPADDPSPPSETDASFSLGEFADDLEAEPPTVEDSSPDALSLDDAPFSLSLDDVSFELDLPSVAKNYVGGEVAADDISLATPERDLDPSSPPIEAESEDLERFSLGDVDLNFNLDLEPDLQFELPPDLDDDLFADLDEPSASDTEANDIGRADSQDSEPDDASKITTLESLNELELFTEEEGNQSEDEPSASPDTPSRITTLESLRDLEAIVVDEAAGPADPQIENGIDLFSDQDGAAPAAKAEVNDPTATMPLSRGSLDLFPSNGVNFGDAPADEAAEASALDTLALLSEAISNEADINQPEPPEPIELFPTDEATSTQDSDVDIDFDLADSGLLDLFPPVAPEPAPVSEAEDTLNVEGDDDSSGLNSGLDHEAPILDQDALAEAPEAPLAVEALLALDGPEPTLPEEWELDAALEVESNPESESPVDLLTTLDGLEDTNALDAENGLDAAPETSETSPPNLSLEALGLALDDTNILADFQVPDLTPDSQSESVVNSAESATDSSAQLLVQSQADSLPTQPPDPPIIESPDPNQEWFLGFDFGTTGISAVLMNRVDGQAYPLYWTDTGIASTTTETLFRLPTVAVFNGAGDADWTVGATGSSALTLNWQGESATTGRSRLATQMKAWLAVGVPHQDAQGYPHPQLRWSNRDILPLPQVMAATQALLNPLSQLKQTRYRDGEVAPVGAAGLDTAHLQRALQQLQGVIVGHGIAVSETYRLNLREVILATQLVPSASQVLFVEAAIAAVLSGLPDPSQPLEPQGNQTQTLYQCQWQGGTVMINAGASGTDLGIVNLPNPLSALGREDFTLRNFAYGGDALDLDIISQLLVPADRRQTRSPGSKPPQGSGWEWQAASPDVQNSRWETLELDALDLPRLAEPDVAARIRLRQQLESSPLGQSLLEAARHGKLILQNQAQFHLELGDQSWRVLRRDLESRILVPYIQRINQHLNALLSETGLSSQGIHQVICTGGNASFDTIARWLRQKFPNATIIQDTYPSNRPPSCSRVAYGLVNLCRYPQVLDGPRHQYSDYFLLQELLRVMPDQPMPVQGIMHLLDQQGVNTEVCHQRVLALLEGHLPPGLVPDMAGRSHLSAASLASEPYQALTTDVLFTRQSGQIYAPNIDACQRMSAHLQMLMAGKQQSLAEPLLAQLVTV